MRTLLSPGAAGVRECRGAVGDPAGVKIGLPTVVLRRCGTLEAGRVTAPVSPSTPADPENDPLRRPIGMFIRAPETGVPVPVFAERMTIAAAWRDPEMGLSRTAPTRAQIVAFFRLLFTSGLTRNYTPTRPAVKWALWSRNIGPLGPSLNAHLPPFPDELSGFKPAGCMVSLTA